jgi:hypothetical protein
VNSLIGSRIDACKSSAGDPNSHQNTLRFICKERLHCEIVFQVVFLPSFRVSQGRTASNNTKLQKHSSTAPTVLFSLAWTALGIIRDNMGYSATHTLLHQTFLFQMYTKLINVKHVDSVHPSSITSDMMRLFCERYSAQ